MTLPLPIQLPLGLFLAVVIGLAAYLAKSLSRGGAIAAAALGTVIFGLGGLPGAIVLLGFFITSSALSHFFKRRKARFDEKFSKGSRRDAGQVLANGGIAGGAMLLIWLASASPRLDYALWLAFCASLAAANADTWGTELGVLATRPPVLITSGKTVEPGTSGGVSLGGTLAALGGAALIALLAYWLDLARVLPLAHSSPAGWAELLGPYGLITLAGLAGSLVDSSLGATVQAIYTCPACHKETERHPSHTCGTPTHLVRGWPWLNNDLVNTACTLSAALLALVLGLALSPAETRPSLKTAAPPATMSLTSTAFQPGQAIPTDYTCLGANRSPDLAWSSAPQGTASLALIVQDPDAPGGTFTHWGIYNMPAGSTGLAAGKPQPPNLPGLGSSGETEGKNSFGNHGYDGPCPPAGKPHHYEFRLYATDLPAGSLPPGLTGADLLKALDTHVLGMGELIGTFQR